MDLEELRRRAGILPAGADENSLLKLENEPKEINTLEDEDSSEGVVQLEMFDGTTVTFDPECEVYYDFQFDVQLSESDPRLKLHNLEKAYADFKEAAGVGRLTKQNTTADVKKGTLKKMAKGYGFDITDGGIPPAVSKDSWKK